MPATPYVMKPAAATTPTVPPLAAAERCEAPCCESPVPSHHVFSRFDFEVSPARRTVVVYCQHCRLFHERSFVFTGVAWSPDGDPVVMNDARRKAALMKRIDQIANTQLAQSA